MCLRCGDCHVSGWVSLRSDAVSAPRPKQQKMAWPCAAARGAASWQRRRRPRRGCAASSSSWRSPGTGWQDLRDLAAAAYLATPATEVFGVAEEPSLPLKEGRFKPEFLASLPPAATAMLLRDMPMVVPGHRAVGTEDEEGPEPSFLTFPCELCGLMADDAETWLRSLTKTYSDPVGGAPMTEGLNELRLPENELTSTSTRMLPHGLFKLSYLKGKFGVVVGDREGWFLSLLLSVGVKDKTHSVHFWNRWMADVEGQSQSLAGLQSATPHRAEWVFIPPGVLDGAGLDPSTGRWDLNADSALMDLVSQALTTGGRVVVSLQVGDDCLVLRKGAAFRAYGPYLLGKVLEKWRVEAHLEYPTGLRLTYGPCRSRPAVLVLRHQWERHPAALLSVKRIDIMPKLFYALHRRQLGRASRHRREEEGLWAEDLYFRCGVSMGALAEHCAFDNNVGAEPCRRKFGREDFHRGFNFLMDSMEYLGFTRAISGLRLDDSGALLNGAHRVAAALAAGMEAVPVTPTALHDGITGGVDQTIMLPNLVRLYGQAEGRSIAAALLLELMRCQRHPQALRELGAALVWPAAALHNFTPTVEAELFEHFFVVMPYWEVHLETHACFNVVQQLYISHDWSKQPEFVRAKAKDACGGDYAAKTTTASLFVFEMQKNEAPVLEKVKSKLRDHHSLGSNALFLSAGPAAAAAIGMLHGPTLDFLTLAPGVKLPELERLPDARSRCLLGDSAVMALLKLRPLQQLELLCDGPCPKDPLVVDHSTEPWRHFYGELADLVHDPSKHFFAQGWRLLAIPQLIAFKEARFAELCKGSTCDFHHDMEEVAMLRSLYGERLKSA
ncbi:unnamed protein product [Effrenium voratum]|uniref:Uncharacterized protein n=1 Tax=Effrenium voratum TaxID=2562239 RepID=A0AA36MVB4_9DINO|nr:unnamed protein product [Effrenium voratum]